jgi:hypothetical protein
MDPTTSTAGSDRGGNAVKPLVRRLLPILAVLLVTSACVPLPRRVTAVEPPRPALTLSQAGAVLTRAGQVLKRTDRDLDAARLGSVLTGFVLEQTRTSYGLHEVTGRRDRSPLARFTLRPARVWSTTATRYPQTALVESGLAGRENARYRALHQLVRTDASSPWLIALALYPEEKVIVRPGSSPDGVTVTPAGTATVAGLRLDRLSSSLVDALNKPTSAQARSFRGQPRRDHFADVDSKGIDEHLTRTLTFFDRTEAVAFLDPSGGSVALVALTHLRTDRGKGDWVTSVAPPYNKAYPGYYREISQAFLDTCLVRLPARGKADVRACESTAGPVSIS